MLSYIRKLCYQTNYNWTEMLFVFCDTMKSITHTHTINRIHVILLWFLLFSAMWFSALIKVWKCFMHQKLIFVIRTGVWLKAGWNVSFDYQMWCYRFSELFNYSNIYWLKCITRYQFSLPFSLSCYYVIQFTSSKTNSPGGRSTIYMSIY